MRSQILVLFLLCLPIAMKGDLGTDSRDRQLLDGDIQPNQWRLDCGRTVASKAPLVVCSFLLYLAISYHLTALWNLWNVGAQLVFVIPRESDYAAKPMPQREGLQCRSNSFQKSKHAKRCSLPTWIHEPLRPLQSPKNRETRKFHSQSLKVPFLTPSLRPI